MIPQMANLSHFVHKLQFGQTLDPRLERRLPEKHRNLMHPLNNKFFLLPMIHQAPQHFINIVTTSFEFGNGLQMLAYQFTSQNRNAHYANDQIPEAKFTWELSPVSVQVSQRRTPFYSFMTYLLAIIGGAFSMISLLTTAMDTVSVQVKKALGKSN